MEKIKTSLKLLLLIIGFNLNAQDAAHLVPIKAAELGTLGKTNSHTWNWHLLSAEKQTTLDFDFWRYKRDGGGVFYPYQMLHTVTFSVPGDHFQESNDLNLKLTFVKTNLEVVIGTLWSTNIINMAIKDSFATWGDHYGFSVGNGLPKRIGNNWVVADQSNSGGRVLDVSNINEFITFDVAVNLSQQMSQYLEKYHHKGDVPMIGKSKNDAAFNSIIKTSVSNVVNHLPEFGGKKVDISGYLLVGPETSGIFSTETDARMQREWKGLYVPMELLPEGKTFRWGVPLRIIGTVNFRKTMSLGMGSGGWPAQLVNIELFEQ